MTSTFDDSAAACTTTPRQGYGAFLFLHADSGNWQKAQKCKIARSFDPTPKVCQRIRVQTHQGGWVLAIRFFGIHAEYDKIDAESV